MESETASLSARAHMGRWIVRFLVYGVASLAWLFILLMVDEGVAAFLDSATISPCSRAMSDFPRMLLASVDVCRWLPVVGVVIIALTPGRSATSVAVALLTLHTLAFFAMQAAVLWALLGLFAAAAP